jgi:hypothetical protein
MHSPLQAHAVDCPAHPDKQAAAASSPVCICEVTYDREWMLCPIHATPMVGNNQSMTALPCGHTFGRSYFTPDSLGKNCPLCANKLITQWVPNFTLQEAMADRLKLKAEEAMQLEQHQSELQKLYHTQVNLIAAHQAALQSQVSQANQAKKLALKDQKEQLEKISQVEIVKKEA